MDTTLIDPASGRSRPGPWVAATRMAGVVLLLLLAGPRTQLEGQVTEVAPQVSYGDRTDLGVGARVVFGLPDWNPRLEAHAGLDLFFPNDSEGLDVGYFEVNLNLLYRFPLEGVASIVPYAGGGFNFARTSVDRRGTPFVTDASSTDVGINLIGGVRFDLGPFSPFVETRFEISGGEQAVVTGGVRLPIA